MTKRDVLDLALKVLGVYCVIRAVPELYMIIGCLAESHKESAGDRVFLAVMLLVPVLWIAIAAVLLMKADALARALVKEDAAVPAMGAPDWEVQVFGLALKVVGVVCLAIGIPYLGLTITSFLSAFTEQHGTMSVSVAIVRALPGIVYSALLLAIGAYLSFCTEHLVAFSFRKQA